MQNNSTPFQVQAEPEIVQWFQNQRTVKHANQMLKDFDIHDVQLSVTEIEGILKQGISIWLNDESSAVIMEMIEDVIKNRNI